MRLVVVLLGLSVLASAQSVLSSHPRILLNSTIRDNYEPSKSRLQAVRDRVAGPAAADFAQFQRAATSYYAGNFQGIIQTVGLDGPVAYAFLYLMTGDGNTYCSPIVTQMHARPAYLTTHASYTTDDLVLVDEGFAVAYDWCHDWIVANGFQAQYISDLKYSWTNWPAWNNGINGVRESDFHNLQSGFFSFYMAYGLAMYGDDPSGATALAQARSMMLGGSYRWDANGGALYPQYNLLASINALTDGAMNWEGPSYWRNASLHFLRAFEEYDSATGRSENLWANQFSNTYRAGLYRIYTTRPDSLQTGLGDSAEGYAPGGKDLPAIAQLMLNFNTNPTATYLKKWATDMAASYSWNDGGSLTELVWKLIFWDYPNTIATASSYNGLPTAAAFGQDVLMRSDWGPNATYVTMTFPWGGIYHRGSDAGDFSIFGNGSLYTAKTNYVVSNGAYYYQWSKRTISGNGLLIYNPSECIRDNTSTCGISAQGTPITNDGGQRYHDAVREFFPPFTNRNGPTVNHYGTNRLWSGSVFTDADPTISAVNFLDQLTRATNRVFLSNGLVDYVGADITKSYQTPWAGQGDQLSNRVSQVTRQLVFVKPGYVVVFDRATAVNASYPKSWVLRTMAAPSISSDGSTWSSGTAGLRTFSSAPFSKTDYGATRLFTQTLLPASSTIRTVGGNTCVANQIVSATAAKPAVFTTLNPHNLVEGESIAIQGFATNAPGLWGSDYGILTDNPNVGSLTVHPTGPNTFTLTNGPYPICGTGTGNCPNAAQFPTTVTITYHTKCGWEGWVDDYTGQQTNLWYPNNLAPKWNGSLTTWRMEVKPPATSNQDYFLEILYPTTTATQSMPQSSLISTTAMYGAAIPDPVQPAVVMFSKDGSAQASVTYTTSSLSGTVKHAIANLVPGTYTVQQGGNTIVSSGGVDSNGLLTFTSSNGGMFAVQLAGTVGKCDLNNDGFVNVLDVQIASIQAGGQVPCTNGDIDGSGSCTQADVNIVVTAALGGSCKF